MLIQIFFLSIVDARGKGISIGVQRNESTNFRTSEQDKRENNTSKAGEEWNFGANVSKWMVSYLYLSLST